MGHDAPGNLRYGKSRPVDSTAAGRGAWMILLLLALQLIQNQFAMLLEYAETIFEQKESRL